MREAHDRSHSASSVRAVVVASLSLCVACATFVLCDLAARRILPLVWLIDFGPSSAISVLCAIGTAILASRFLPAFRSKWLLVPAIGAPPIFVVSAVLLPLSASLSLGTPAHGCQWTGVTGDQCIGRDWSFLQDRLGHTTIVGAINPTQCTAFRNGVLEVPADSKVNGWIRCPSDDPKPWRRARCSDVALAEMDTCFSCGGTSGTSDEYLYAIGFDSGCMRVKVRFGLNVPLHRIDDCAKTRVANVCRELVAE